VRHDLTGQKEHRVQVDGNRRSPDFIAGVFCICRKEDSRIVDQEIQSTQFFNTGIFGVRV